MNWKSILASFVALLAGVALCNAQNDALAFIAKKNAQVSSLESSHPDYEDKREGNSLIRETLLCRA